LIWQPSIKINSFNFFTHIYLPVAKLNDLTTVFFLLKYIKIKGFKSDFS